MDKDKSAYSQIMHVKPFDIEAKLMVCIMNCVDARELGLFPLDRVELRAVGESRRHVVTVVNVTKTMVKEDEIGIFKGVREKLGLRKNSRVRVTPVQKPASVGYIKKKLDGEQLSEQEIRQIVDDFGNNALSEIESSAFVSAVYVNGFTLDETVAMTKALADDGCRMSISKKPVVDKHCIGGTNGRTTMIIVPIVAAEGCFAPKTSSRSITSAAGTADVMEVLANVCLSMDRIKGITERVGGVIAWGGALDLAPVDDEIIKIEHPFSLDPPGQVIASVMAKKASVGSKFVVIDLPVGPDVKIHSKEKAEDMARKFIEVGKQLGMRVEAVLTDGTQPCGRAFGPMLEARHVMQILEGEIFDDLAQKSCELAGLLLELCGKAEKGKGFARAEECLKSGRALKKMQEIIRAQGAHYLRSRDMPVPKQGKIFLSKEQGKVSTVNVRKCNSLARIAGAPADQMAGVYLYVQQGEAIGKKQPLFMVYASNKRKLKLAMDYAKSGEIVELERNIIEKMV